MRTATAATATASTTRTATMTVRATVRPTAPIMPGPCRSAPPSCMFARVIVGFDATTRHGRISGVGYYTARLMESLANGAGDGVVERLVVLAHREVPVPPGHRVDAYERHPPGVGLIG